MIRKKRKQRVLGFLLIGWGVSYFALDALGLSNAGHSALLFVVLFFMMLAVIAFGGAKGLSRRPGDDVHLRGGELIDFREAEQRAKRLKASDKSFWGMMWVSDSLSPTHFLVAGSTGSGKTISLRLLMQSVLCKIQPGSDKRALIYDAKQDILSILAGMGVTCPIVILNPYDKRCSAWDMSKDITCPSIAQQVASILIPEDKRENNRYFSDAPRDLLTGVMISFAKRLKQDWTFRDVMLAMRSPNVLRRILSMIPDTEHLLCHLEHRDTAKNVLASVSSHLQRFEIIAAAWDRAETKVSLIDFIEGESIFVLGNDDQRRTGIDAINRVLLQRITELILSSSESTTRRTWVFLDELREAGELKGLNRLLTKGRSKGACVVIGFQDIEGLRAVYGKEVANELVGLCANKSFLRTDSPETAKWASEVFAQREVLETRYSEGSSKSFSMSLNPWRDSAGKNSSTTEHVTKRDLILPAEFLSIPPTTKETGLTGVYSMPLIGSYKVSVSGKWIDEHLLEPDNKFPNVILRPAEDEYLRPWDDQDLIRLGLKDSAGEDPEGGGNGGSGGLQFCREAMVKRERGD